MSDYQAQRLTAYARDRGRCVVCLGPGQQCHHRQGRGGKDPHRLSNLITVCGGCHDRIHRNPAESYQAGWMVRRLGMDTPETVPVRYGDLMVHLSNDFKETSHA